MSASTMPRTAAAARPMTAEERKVIIASSAGAVFEWYDFYLYGSLAAIIGAQFFSAYPESARNIFALLAFAAGFLVRPFGAVVFGRLGDLLGRKYTFLITITLMGASTFIVGILPGSATIGIAAPIILLVLRCLQGLAIGGEYGGAATYVAEHAPQGRRGFYTSFIQITATGGLFLSLIVILVVRSSVGEPAFAAWGWRIPFVVSILLLGASVWIRMKLSESPAFARIKAEGKASKAPLSEAFGQWKNAKWALIALVSLCFGQTVVFYCSQLYSLFFMGAVLKVDGYTANLLIGWALLIGVGFFVFFGWLSDKIGRKPVFIAGCVLAAGTYFPIFNALTATANPALYQAQQAVPVVVTADPADCSFQFNPVGTARFNHSCDIVKSALASAGIPYSVQDAPAGTIASITVGGRRIEAFHAEGQPAARLASFRSDLGSALTAAGYPAANNPSVAKMTNPLDIFRPQIAKLIGLLTLLVIYVTMVYGPLAAALVELFPTRIRYTALSLPYHIGSGWVGGLLPAVSFAMIAQTGDIYFGLWYPVGFAIIAAVATLLLLPETYRRDIFAETMDSRAPPAAHTVPGE